MDGLLDKYPNRQCYLIKASNLGKDFKNGTFTGALKLLKSKVVKIAKIKLKINLKN